MKVNRDSAVAFAIGLACIALIVGGIVFMQRGDRIDLPGRILKVRTAPLDENSAVVVIDFRITNPSGVQFMVRTVQVEMDDNEGKSYLGDVAADMDAVRPNHFHVFLDPAEVRHCPAPSALVDRACETFRLPNRCKGSRRKPAPLIISQRTQ